MTTAHRSSLRRLDGIRPLYILPSDPFAEEVLIPAFRNATTADCMVGFFSSAVLASLAPGLAAYISATQHSFRLIVSPMLSAEDQEAIRRGLKSAADVADSHLASITITEDLLQRHTLECLSWLLRNGRLEIKVALMTDALFHPKVWLFASGEDVLVAHGSSNLTLSGISRNVEQIAVSRSWQTADQDYITRTLARRFAKLWDDDDDDCVVIALPDAIRRRIIQTYNFDSPPSDRQLLSLLARGKQLRDGHTTYAARPTRFSIPSHLRYTDGPFAHQGDAVAAWCRAGHRGVLEMATGSGKTIAAMICAHRLYQTDTPLLIVVAVPYVPLLDQWATEIADFGLTPINMSAVGGALARTRTLERISRRFRSRLSDVAAVVVSHDTLCSPRFLDAINNVPGAHLLIADEAHNLGRQAFTTHPPTCFQHRLALSATPVRQYDDDGTRKLFAFFGPVVFQYTLEQAIGHCLVEYEYYIHPAHLTSAEMDDWYALTQTIRRNAWRGENGKPDTYLAKLLRDRRAILETATDKLSTLRSLLAKRNKDEIRHTLVYASDKGPGQLEAINEMLAESNILFHQLTAEETATRRAMRTIMKSFRDGELQVLTAKRVLDEGVDIPEICHAYLLASTTLERQWIQRRGRVLRKCDRIGKTFSVIHDFPTLPPDSDDMTVVPARDVVRSELRRVREFASLAMNAGRRDGPLTVIDRMARTAYTY